MILRSLPLFHRIAGRPVLVLGEGAAAEPKVRLVERAGGTVITQFQPAIDAGARLAFVAYEDEALATCAATRLRSAGLLVNVVDRPDLCDFTTPSILDRDPVLIAVGTDGRSAGLAKHIRLRLERILPATLGSLADALYAARGEIRSRWPETRQRRAALDEALQADGQLDPLVTHSGRAVADWLNGDGADLAEAEPVTIRLTSNDPDDLTLRTARLLGQADAVFHAQEISAAILDRARADAVRVPFESARGPSIEGNSRATVILLAP